ncbi:MAG: T9SS type A sorting domain-containing protein [Bacteroidota bacterium]
MRCVSLVLALCCLFSSVSDLVAQLAPGGVGTGLQLWLRAQDYQVQTPPAIWQPHAGELNAPMQENPMWMPLPGEAGRLINGNPVVAFDGVDDHLLFLTNSFDALVGNFEAFIVYHVPAAGGALLGGQDGADVRFSLGAEGQLITGRDTLSLVADTSTPTLLHVHHFGTHLAGRINGAAWDSVAASTWDAITGPVAIGQQGFSGLLPLEGGIGEVILYNRRLDAFEADQVQTYLAVKYGLTMARSYYASDSAQVWSQFGHPENAFNVAGIGRDDAAGLLQTASRSVLPAAIVSMRATGALPDLAYLIWGSSDSTLNERPAVINGEPVSVLRRQWHIHKRKEPGPIEVTFDLRDAIVSGAVSADYWLVLDQDEDPANGIRSAYPAAVVDSDSIVFSGLHFEDDDFMSLITHNPGRNIINVALATEAQPREVQLNSAYPNPFVSQTRIQYTLPRPNHTRVRLIDLLGRTVRVMQDSWQPAGIYTLSINRGQLPAGVYYVQLKAGPTQIVRQVTILR